MKLSSNPTETPSGRILSRVALLAALAGGGPACSGMWQEGFYQPPKSESTGHEREEAEPNPKHPESIPIAKEAVALKSYMHPEEVDRMQVMNEELYEQYLNPGFIMYAKAMGISDRVYPSMDLVIGHPYDFEYEDKGHKQVDITKRQPYTQDNQHVPDAFRIEMGGTEPEALQFHHHNLRFPDGRTPWMTSDQFYDKSDLYAKMYRNEWRSNLYGYRYQQWVANGQQPPSEWQQIFRDSFGGIMPEHTEIYEALNIDFPKRFVDLIHARGFDFELRDPRFRDVVQHQRMQGPKTAMVQEAACRYG